MTTPWWDHEPTLLDDALLVFADWRDQDNNASSSEASTPQTSTSSTPTRQASPPVGPRPVKINRSRERQKQEMLQLQQQVVDLEEELLRLRMKSEKRPRLPQPTAVGEHKSSSTAIQAWENATRRQFRSRKKAEALNARLREMYRTQTSVAEDLLRVIQRAEALRQQAYATAIFPVHEPAFTLSARASDQELQHNLMRISAQWHVPFAQCAKFRRENIFFETTILRDDGLESLLEIRASMVFPHERYRMEEELWAYFRSLSCTEDEFSLATESKEVSDTLLGSLRATVAKDGVLGVLDARFMKQQFRNERGELIITSTTRGRPGLRRTRGPKADEALAQVDAVVSEDSWLRVLDAEDPPLSNNADESRPLTCIQNVRRARIQFCGTDRPDRREIDDVKKFLARLAENEVRWGCEVVERRLMLGPCNLMPLTA